MTQTPPGWYPDPYAQGRPILRYFDGVTWTEHVQSAPPAQTGVKTTPDGQILSGWWRRVGAYLIDGLIIVVLMIPVYIPVMIPMFREAFDQANQAAQNGTSPPLFPTYTTADFERLAVLGLAALVLTVVYNALFLRWKAATPGKLAVGIRIRMRETPGKLPWDVIFKRLAVQQGFAFLSWIPVVGSLAALWPYLDDLWPLWDQDKQALHEKWAGTNVVVHNQWAQWSAAGQGSGPVY